MSSPQGGNNTKNYSKQGGDENVIGGKLTIAPGGALVLPTSNPGISGALWNNEGSVAISAG